MMPSNCDSSLKAVNQTRIKDVREELIAGRRGSELVDHNKKKTFSEMRINGVIHICKLERGQPGRYASKSLKGHANVPLCHGKRSQRLR